MKAHRVQICSAGSGWDCVVSAADSFPIAMLRKGFTISHNNGQCCDASCVASIWSGSRVGHLWATCGNSTGGALTRLGAFFFQACDNGGGLHLSATPGGLCGWSYGALQSLEVFIDAPAVQVLAAAAAEAWQELPGEPGAAGAQAPPPQPRGATARGVAMAGALTAVALSALAGSRLVGRRSLASGPRPAYGLAALRQELASE